MAMASCSNANEEVDSITELMDSISISSYSVGSTHWIQVTHIDSPNSFYVRPTACDKFLPSLQAPGSIIDPNDINLGSIIIYKSNVLNGYIRGQIIFINTENQEIKVELFAMDYGHIERDIPLCEVYYPLNFNALPSLVKHCQLELCKPKGDTWEEESIEAMRFYIGHERTKIIVQDETDDLLTVKMYNSCPEDISTMLALMGYSTFGYDPHNSINRFSANPPPKKNYYRFRKLNVGDCLYVRMQSGKSLDEFYVAEIDSYQSYLEQRENIAYFARQDDAISVDNLHEGLPVCVPTINRYKYERALIKKVDQSDTALVQLVDWGDIIQVPLERIKPIRDSFLERGVVSIYCKAVENQVWDHRLLKFLYPGFLFIIKIVSLGDQLQTPYTVNVSEWPRDTHK